MISSLCRHAACRRLGYVRAVASSVSRSGTKSPPNNESLHLAVPTNTVSTRALRTTSMPLQAQAISPAAAHANIGAASGEQRYGTGGGGGAGGEGGRTAGIALFSTLVAVTVGLGSWQAKRYFWKVDLVESRKKRMGYDPIDLPTDSKGLAIAQAMDALDKAEAWSDGGATSSGCAAFLSPEGREALAEYEGRRVRITGVFDHTREVLVGPRGAPPGLKEHSGGASMSTSPMGDFIYTPLKIKNGPTVLFNRGWAPRKGGLDWDRPTGQVTVVGVLKAAEQRGTFSPEIKNPESRLLLWPEKESLLTATGLSNTPTILVEAVAADDVDARSVVPMAKQKEHFCEFYVMPDTHLMYSGTWFSLAAAASILTWVRFRKKPPTIPTRPPSSPQTTGAR